MTRTLDNKNINSRGTLYLPSSRNEKKRDKQNVLHARETKFISSILVSSSIFRRRSHFSPSNFRCVPWCKIVSKHLSRLILVIMSIFVRWHRLLVLVVAIATTCGATGSSVQSSLQSSLPLATGHIPPLSTHKLNALPPASMTTSDIGDHHQQGLMQEVRSHSRGGPVWFAFGQVIAVASAYLFPKMGCTGGHLHLDTIVGQFGVLIIFFLNGLSLSPNQLKTASSHWKINLLTQVYNQLLIPFMVASVITPQITHPGYRDGIICLAALPCTVHLSTTIAQAAGLNPNPNPNPNPIYHT